MNLSNMNKSNKAGIFTTAGNVVDDTINVIGEASKTVVTTVRTARKSMEAVEGVMDEILINQKLDIIGGLMGRGLDLSSATALYNQQVENPMQLQTA